MDKKLKGLHVHDNFGDNDAHTAPYTGTCDYGPVLEGLLAIVYNGCFTLESYALLPANRSKRTGRLAELTHDIIINGADLMYDIIKHMLSSYGMFSN